MTTINDEIERVERILKDSKDYEILKYTSRIKHLEDSKLKNKNELEKLKKKFNEWLAVYQYSRPLLRLEYLKDAQNIVERFTRPISLTLTFIGSEIRIKKEMEERFLTLIHKVCKKIKKNKFSKRGVWLEHFTVKEFNDTTRGHIHTIINVPEGITYGEFINIIQSFWNHVGDLRAGYKNLKHKPKIWESEFNSIDDALGYLLKEQTKDYSKDFSSFIIP